MSERTPTCVWHIADAVVRALDERFGEPTDAYVNGSQTWLRDDGPGGITLEWRLHPVPGFARPAGVGTHDVFAEVAYGLATGESPLRAEQLWDGLEAFPAYGDDVEPQPLVAAVTAALGIAPDTAGLVDHEAIADAWEAARGEVSIVAALFDQLRS